MQSVDLSTRFLPIRESRVHRVICATGAETLHAKLPSRLRHYIAYRRSPNFRVAQILQANDSNDYELATQDALDCVFVHIPKAAGVSVSQALFKTFAGGHLPLHYYLWLYGAWRFDKMFKFSIVRHPFDRCYSAYRFLNKGGLTPIDKLWAEQWVQPYPSFDAFAVLNLRKIY